MSVQSVQADGIYRGECAFLQVGERMIGGQPFAKEIELGLMHTSYTQFDSATCSQYLTC